MDEMTTGNCFPIALHEAEKIADPGVYVVHGLPIGTGVENRGQRYWHAWVETVERMPIPDSAPKEFYDNWPDGILIETVIDRSNGNDFKMPKAMFYNAGQLDEEHVWRYSVDEAELRSVATGHYGPWVDNYEEMGL